MTDNWMDNVKDANLEDSLGALSRLIDVLDEIVTDQTKLETELKELRDRRQKLESEQIPEFLDQFGLSEIKLSDGRKVSVSQDTKVSLPSKNLDARRRVLEFISSHGGEAIIRDELTLLDPSSALVDALVDRGENFDRKESIHPSTLKSFFNEILGLKKGFEPMISISDVPPEAGLFILRKAKIS